MRVNQRAVEEAGLADGLDPLRVTIREIMLAALLHDLGKQHEDCAPFIELMRQTDLRGDGGEDTARRADLLGIVRDIHCRKGPCMIDRLREAGRAELDQLILKLSKTLGVTFVVVTHELPSIYTIADRCIMLDKEVKGIVAVGKPEGLRDHSDNDWVRRFFNRQAEA